MNRNASKLRIGAVQYLNSRPLIECLPALFPHARIEVDVPSRLADGLAEGRFDVALVPSIEAFRLTGATIVADACVACDGPVRSVKLLGRVPPEAITTLAVDEGSRTSAALARILLKEQHALQPQLQPLPIGASVEDSSADAVVLIGDRAMTPCNGQYHFVWDLGHQWRQWTGLPFVFAMWTAAPGIDPAPLADRFAEARDRGVALTGQIAQRAARELGISADQCRDYLDNSLIFRLGTRQREGLARFAQLAIKHGLAPQEALLVCDR